jgi:hypothetical protein
MGFKEYRKNGKDRCCQQHDGKYNATFDSHNRLNRTRLSWHREGDCHSQAWSAHVFKFFKKKPSIIVATLNARLQPQHRAELEDALESVMAERGLSLRIVGGGTELGTDGEVSSCDIEIELDELSDKTINLIVEALTAMLAPKGSRLHIFDQDRHIDFGGHEGLALYLNGTELPDSVYQTCDSNHVYDECNRLLEGVGTVNSHWQGPEETALYMYGASFEAMQERLAPFLQTYPLCQQCRVVQIA